MADYKSMEEVKTKEKLQLSPDTKVQRGIRSVHPWQLLVKWSFRLIRRIIDKFIKVHRDLHFAPIVRTPQEPGQVGSSSSDWQYSH